MSHDKAAPFTPARPVRVDPQPLRSSARPIRHADPAWAAWQAHVDAGRIGSRPKRTFEQRLRMILQEKILFGRVVTRELEEF